VSDPSQRWSEVGLAISTRLLQLHLTPAEIERDFGISWKTLRGYEAGKPIVRRDKRRQLLAALQWTDDSIERILRGQTPITWEDDLRAAESDLFVAAYEVERLGGGEAIGHYHWLRSQVDEKRARLGMPAVSSDERELAEIGARLHALDEMLKPPDRVDQLEERLTSMEAKVEELQGQWQVIKLAIEQSEGEVRERFKIIVPRDDQFAVAADTGKPSGAGGEETFRRPPTGDAPEEPEGP
jgi:tetrahydromethanopterin S-methyltransferase subunit G